MDYVDLIAKIIADISKNPQISVSLLHRLIEEAPKNVDADYSLMCFKIQKFFKKKGPEIAGELAAQINATLLASHPAIKTVAAAGPYLNFVLDKSVVARDTIAEIFQDVNKFALSKVQEGETGQRIVIEYPSPNTNKPLHFGHVRNMLLGQALVNLNKKIGNTVFETNLLNDRGIHICKSMWAYREFGGNQTPEDAGRKSDHFVGDFYVKFAQEEHRRKAGLGAMIQKLEEEKKKLPEDQDIELIAELESKIAQTPYGQMQDELQQMLVLWEQKDPEVRALWRKMNDWAEQGFKETFQRFHIDHDKTYYESKIYDKGKEIVIKGVQSGLFERLEDGAVVVRFNKKGLPKQKVLLRNDGTSLYITQDLFLAYQKYQDFEYDQSIYVVGNEQNMQLKTLFAILKMLGMKTLGVHYSYGMISLTSGKMKSREGKVVDADEVVRELEGLARQEITARYPDIEEEEAKKRAARIAMAALRFFILKYEYTRDFIFDPEQSISFEGDTGPYIMYSYARICSIFTKSLEQGISVPFDPQTAKKNQNFGLTGLDFSKLEHEDEEFLVSLMAQYPDKLKFSALNRKPHELARFLLELAQQFTKFYHSCLVISEKPVVRNLRLAICEAVRQILHNGLEVLEIQPLTEM